MSQGSLLLPPTQHLALAAAYASQGYGFLEFQDPSVNERVIRELNGAPLGKKTIAGRFHRRLAAWPCWPCWPGRWARGQQQLRFPA